ncbi:zinc finger protein 609-like isoform X2 [Denticeps clupeoides]|uniref:C2H2-type domain-containing protein n=2 Tax=Denticeps clupeoides TaxID=299321 RepID=A0AAY4CHB6_9TELE|nr:zinc finger protein 609-like isoform X2 [Denticeps clupeoides]
MSLSGGTAGGKGVDSNAVDTYDSGDEWDIGVGNLIIDLDADLEKDKLEMSGSKEAGGMTAPPSAVAALPDNIKFVSPVTTPQAKENKSKSKRSKVLKDNSKAQAGDGTKKEPQGRAQGETANSTPSKSTEKGAKVTRSMPNNKKDKESVGRSKKDKNEVPGISVSIAIEKDGVQTQALGCGLNAAFESTPNATDSTEAEEHGINALETVSIVPLLTVKSESEDLDSGECRVLKKVKSEKMESPITTPAPPCLPLLSSVESTDIASSCEQIMVRTRSVAISTLEMGIATEPECLGPCEPGTSVNLEGIVWQETDDGMLVVNVTWRNKTYVGTLLDCTRHDWAPPRFCESPTSDLEMRNSRGRGKRMRPNNNTPVNENGNSSDNKVNNSSKTRGGSNSKGRRGSQNSSEQWTPPNSNTEDVKASPSSAGKRKTKAASDMEPNSSSEDNKGNKRMRTNSNSGGSLPNLPIPSIKSESLPTPLDINCSLPVLIDCPHPNCNKKYKHINGLKYHQARAHNDEDIKLEMDCDSEYGEEAGGCSETTASQRGSLSPARCATPKGKACDPSQSPSPGKFGSKQGGKKRNGDLDTEAYSVPMVGCEDGLCLTDEASNDGSDRSKKSSSNIKPDKLQQKNSRSSRPLSQAVPLQQICSLQATSFSGANLTNSPQGLSASIQGIIPKSPPLKAIQLKSCVMADPSFNTASSSSKDKKKRDKKKKGAAKEPESPKPLGKGGRSDGGKSPYSESSDQGTKNDGLLNGSSEPHQSRLASIKAEADKIYSFTDNAPSPSIGVASRIESSGAGQPHTVHNGTDNSPAYSDISDAGEDGEGKVDCVKPKVDDQALRDGTKKALFSVQPPSKNSPYYSSYENYYSPSYTHPSPSSGNVSSSLVDGSTIKVKKEDDQEHHSDDKLKVVFHENHKSELGASGQQQSHHVQQQPSVIQQRSNMYMQPLYYNQYYMPPFSYPDQVYHNHLMNTNPAYRQQYEERQRQMSEQHQGTEKKSERDGPTEKEEWKQKSGGPPADLGKPQSLSSKQKDSVEHSKSVITPKIDYPKRTEGLKVKLSDGGQHGKEDTKPCLEPGKPSSLEQPVWYRQDPCAYLNKYPDGLKQHFEEGRERRSKDERPRSKERTNREECKEMADPRSSAEDQRGSGKEPRPNAHMQFSSALAQHQPYMPYVHGYPYSQGYELNHPGYRAMPAVMMQNYPGSYLPAGYPFSPYGGKLGSSEEVERSRASPTVSGKTASDSKALDILHQHVNQYKSKSPTVTDKPPPHERERGPIERERDRERDLDRPRSSPVQRVMSSHHHLGYSLLPGQYDLSYTAGLSSSAIISSQQTSAPSLYPPARR